MKAMRVAEAADLAPVADLRGRPPTSCCSTPSPAPGPLPGGNGLSFDWRLLATGGRRPWLLAGGLHAGERGRRGGATGAPVVDVSSGVESRPGVKDPARLEAFLQAARLAREPAEVSRMTSSTA